MTVEVSGAGDVLARLDRDASKLLSGARLVTAANAHELTENWRANARITAGEHGRRYPSSITDEVVPHLLAAEWVIGPETGKPQGGMGPGFENGSVNQPPHLDGKRAAEAQASKYEHELVELIGGLL